jgi:hypothetical protein
VINHIDVSSVLRGTVCDLYSNLVTRSTGAAVRTEIEHQLAELHGRTLNVIDFSQVGLLDFSCADEVVAKLLLRYRGDPPPDEAYFLFRGMNESHLDAIETVLERHGLALVVLLDDGAPHLIGAVDDRERRAWEAVCRLGRAAEAEVLRALGVEPRDASALLDGLCRRRLVMRLDDVIIAVGGSA